MNFNTKIYESLKKIKEKYDQLNEELLNVGNNINRLKEINKSFSVGVINSLNDKYATLEANNFDLELSVYKYKYKYYQQRKR